MADVKWVATLSDGTTAAEESGEWKEIPGERKPWVRLMEYTNKNRLHLTSLRLNIDGKTIHMPRGDFDRFNFNETQIAPNSYSLTYHIEGEFVGAIINEERFIDLAAHFDGYAVHYLQNITDPNLSWIIVSNGKGRQAVSPDKRLHGDK